MTKKGGFALYLASQKASYKSKPKSPQKPASRKSKPHTKVLNLWILRCAQYDKQTLVILSE